MIMKTKKRDWFGEGLVCLFFFKNQCHVSMPYLSPTPLDSRFQKGRNLSILLAAALYPQPFKLDPAHSRSSNVSRVEFTIDIQTKSRGRHRTVHSLYNSLHGKGKMDEKEVSQPFNCRAPVSLNI